MADIRWMWYSLVMLVTKYRILTANTRGHGQRNTETLPVLVVMRKIGLRLPDWPFPKASVSKQHMIYFCSNRSLSSSLCSWRRKEGDVV